MTFLSRSDETAPAFPLGLLFFVCLILAWSWIGAADRMTWWLEAFPALIALPVLAITYKRFQFTRLAFVLIALHACIFISWRTLHL
jgi:putative membrane protein